MLFLYLLFALKQCGKVNQINFLIFILYQLFILYSIPRAAIIENHKFGGLKQQKFTLAVLEVRNQDVCSVTLPSKALGKNPCLFQFQVAPGSSRLVAACFQSLLPSSYGLPLFSVSPLCHKNTSLLI